MIPTKTARGFALIEFTDRYGVKCSLQKSSLASEDAIWFGVDDPEPKIMASEAAELGVVTDQLNGWVPYPIPGQVQLSTRMHLTREQVRELLPHLKAFADTGEIQRPAPSIDEFITLMRNNAKAGAYGAVQPGGHTGRSVGGDPLFLGAGDVFFGGRRAGRATRTEILKGREGPQTYLLDGDYAELERRALAFMQEQADTMMVDPAPVRYKSVPKMTDHKRVVKRKPNTGPKGRW